MQSTLDKDYSDFVAVLKKPDHEVLQSLREGDCDLIHMTMGIAGEAGELLDAIKKYTIYRKPLDIENVIEELGDLEFYMEGLRQRIGVDRGTIIDLNIKKLSKRYPNGYNNKSAIERADKAQ